MEHYITVMTDIISDRHVQGMDITSERNVQGTDNTSERNIQLFARWRSQ